MVVVTEHSDVPEVMMFLAADEVLFQHEQWLKIMRHNEAVATSKKWIADVQICGRHNLQHCN